jgi:hypothetical protein
LEAIDLKDLLCTVDDPEPTLVVVDGYVACL